ncbi:MAG: DUF1566 domain-containing protein [Leptospiraceae bacterium]|nr:DUF1566 domain-containing protein [Leptospiraceae bacterium]
MKKLIFVLLIAILGLSCEKKEDDKTPLLAGLLALAGGGSAGGTGGSCAESSITRSWGCFTDMNDGTVRLAVTAGTFGSQTYTAQTLFYAKCSHGQTYDAGSNTCTGATTTVKYCSVNDNSCNGGTDTGILDGSGTSGAYTACNGLSLASKTWRVPTKNELKLLINCNDGTTMPNDAGSCGAGNFTAPTINSLFPNTTSGAYWSSTSTSLTGAVYIFFSNSIIGMGGQKQPNNMNVRCVSGP